MSDRKERREIQEKLNRQYIDQKLNPIMEPMTLAFFVLEHKKDPVDMFLVFLKDNFGNRPSVFEGERI